MVPLFVACLLFASPVLADHHHDSHSFRFNCGRAVEECTETYLDNFPRINNLTDVQQMLANRSMVVEMANALEVTTSCMENVRELPGCYDQLDWVSVVRLNVDFINSPGTIDKIVAVSQSPCLADVNVVTQAYNAINECERTFDRTWRAKMSNLCEGFSQLWQCIENTITQFCGAQFGELFTSWKQFVLSEPQRTDFMNWLNSETNIDLYVCQYQLSVTRRYIKEVLPLLNNF